MKRAIIVHRWGGGPASDWYPWLKDELKKRSYAVHIPVMPETDAPKIQAWVKALGIALEGLGEVDDLLLIGHSIGCQTILRYLEAADVRARLIFVAPWFSVRGIGDESRAIARPWEEMQMSVETIRERIISATALFSRDDPYVSVAEAEIFKERFDTNTLMFKGYGHFDENANVRSIPELLPIIDEFRTVL